MFNLNLDKIIAAVNRLAMAIEEINITIKQIYGIPIQPKGLDVKTGNEK